jgi:phthalate 4,5-dioxygenase oxygenase subunit
MLSQQDNESMCRVGPNSPMGQALRRYWAPALQSSDLPDCDGAPRLVELFGERFVAFRDTNGRVGLLDELCCHRGASLTLGRVEDCGIRCIYHGWKFATDGTVLETPNVADPMFKNRFKAKAYPVREAGGLIWTYLGPTEKEPPFPRWRFLDAPDERRINAYLVEDCNFVQVIEGLVDSSHLSVLHIAGLKATNDSDLSFAKKTNHMQFNAAPRIEAEETDFGFHYAALRPGSDGEGAFTEARVAAFAAPFFVANPNADLAFACVPVNDTRTIFYHVWWDDSRPIGAEPLRSQQLKFVGLDPEALDAYGLSWVTCDSPTKASQKNNFLQNRQLMREGHFSGIRGFTQEDVAVSISAGPIRDRTKERLSVADLAIGRLYRSLLSCVSRIRENRDPVGLLADASKIGGANGKLRGDADWRSLVPDHKATSSSVSAEVA